MTDLLVLWSDAFYFLSLALISTLKACFDFTGCNFKDVCFKAKAYFEFPVSITAAHCTSYDMMNLNIYFMPGYIIAIVAILAVFFFFFLFFFFFHHISLRISVADYARYLDLTFIWLSQ